MSWPRPIRVVGVGSPLGDDALAWEVVQNLRQQKEWQDEVEFHTVEGGQRLLDVLDGQGSLVLIDALAPAGRAGTIQRFEWPDPRVEVLRPGSTHHLRPAETLQLAATLGILPAQVVIWGIEGDSLNPQSNLSPAVAAAVREIVPLIITELAAITGGATDEHA